MTTKQEAPTVEETLNKTDFGTIINENKKPILIGAAILLMGVIAYTLTSHFSQLKSEDHLNRIFQVETTVFKPFTTDKVKAPEFLKSLGNMNSELIGDAALAPAFLAAMNKLSADKPLPTDIVSIFGNWSKRMDKKSYVGVFFNMRLATAYENNKMYKEALALLEGMKNSKLIAFEEKVHLDLGRMYMMTSQNTKAIESFTYVADKFKDTEFAKLANLYLSKVKK